MASNDGVKLEAKDREWRTLPLGGLGLRDRVDGAYQFFLHEAVATATAFRNLAAEDRAAAFAS